MHFSFGHFSSLECSLVKKTKKKKERETDKLCFGVLSLTKWQKNVWQHFFWLTGWHTSVCSDCVVCRATVGIIKRCVFWLWLAALYPPSESVTCMCGCEELRMELWFRRKPSFNPLTACQTVGMGRACADHPPLTQFSTRPPPSKSHLACHLSPRPPKKKKKKITPRSIQGPSENHVKLLHLLQRGGKSADGWQLFEGVEGGGCEGGQCHTKGGQEGKISHPWSVRQRRLFFLGGGGGFFLFF